MRIVLSFKLKLGDKDWTHGAIPFLNRRTRHPKSVKPDSTSSPVVIAAAWLLFLFGTRALLLFPGVISA